jgi:hypothetical protein
MDSPQDNRLGHGSRAKRIVAIDHLLTHKAHHIVGNIRTGLHTFFLPVISPSSAAWNAASRESPNVGIRPTVSSV